MGQIQSQPGTSPEDRHGWFQVGNQGLVAVTQEHIPVLSVQEEHYVVLFNSGIKSSRLLVILLGIWAQQTLLLDCCLIEM